MRFIPSDYAARTPFGTDSEIRDADGFINTWHRSRFFDLYQPAPASPPQGAAEGDAKTPISRGPSREWLERAGDIEDATRSVSVGGLAADAGMYEPKAADSKAAVIAAAKIRLAIERCRNGWIGLVEVPKGHERHWHGVWDVYTPQVTVQARHLRALLAAAEASEHYRQACIRQGHEIEQTLGKALGYPRYADDPKAFPGATDADGVCVGERVAASLADEAADRIRDLQGKLAAAESPPCPSKAWAHGFAHGLRDGCPGPERFWEHDDDFAAGFDAARGIKGELPPAEARPQVGDATKAIIEALAKVARAGNHGGGTLYVEHCDDDSITDYLRADDVLAALRECGMEVEG